MLRRLLLLPLLAPLLAVLLVGALNPRPSYRLRLLIWSTPALPVGVWIALAGAGGAALSAGATVLALRAGGAELQRSLRREPERTAGAGPEPPAPERARRTSPEAVATAGGSWPKRAPQDPPPTVSVPFRVIRKGSGAAAASRSGAARPAEPVAAAPPPAAGGTRETEGEESWDGPVRDDW